MKPVLELSSEKIQNGLKIISNRSNSDSVAVYGSIKAGAIFDDFQLLGTAELVSNLITRGTKARRAAEISSKIEKIGATLKFTNSDEAVFFSARCHSKVFEDLVSIISECIVDPDFPDKEIEKSRAEIASEIRFELDDTRSSAHRRLMSLLYGNQMPYGRNPLGTMKTLSKIARNDLMRFYEATYSPERTIIALTGNIDHSDAVQILEDHFGSWYAAPKPSFEKLNSQESGPSFELISMKHKSQADIALGVRAVPRNSEEYYAMNLGNLILGKIGLYGRLGDKIREEKGLAYYCFSLLQSKMHTGHLVVYAGVNPMNISSAIKGVMEEILRMANQELSGEELAKAKKNSFGSLLISLDNSAERANVVHDVEYYQLGLDYVEKYEDLLGSVSTSNVLSAFSKRMVPERISLAIAGPVDAEKLDLPPELIRAAQVQAAS